MTKKVIIVAGTSFVGQRFLRYFHHYFKENQIEVLVTARDLNKLNNLLKDLEHYKGHQLDSLNRNDVQRVIKDAFLVVNFAGPYDLYSENIIEACARGGIHYLDITGEVNFSKRMMNLYEKDALQNKCSIISFAGFDSVPSDYAVYLASKFAQQNHSQLKSVDIIYKLKGGINGGTIRTGFDMSKKLSEKEVSDRNYLTPKSAFYQADLNFKRFIKEKDLWVSPFFMESINSKVIYRSLYLTNSKSISEDFSFRESIVIPGGSLINSCYTILNHQLSRALKNNLSSSFMRFVLPKPGDGPSEDSIESGFVKGIIIARLENGITAEAKLKCPGDPGNKATIKFLGSIMKVLLNEDSLKCGFLTPSTACQERVFTYFKEEGIEFSPFQKEISPATS